MKKKITFALVLVLITAVFYSFSRQIFNSLQAGQRLDKSVEELSILQRQNTELKKKLAETEKIEFIEQQARDKLNLARNGETAVVISDQQIEEVLKKEKPKEEPKLPNWKGWVKLFLK